jgi:hypothetical protein
MKFITAIFLLFLLSIPAISGELDDALEGRRYIFRLKNGDLITGDLVNFVNDEKEGKGVEVETDIGLAVIYEKQISDIEAFNEYYRHKHRIFLQPTAHPIGRDHFAGFYELLFLYAGAGYKFASLTAGRSFIPGIRSEDQVTVVNGKITFLDNALPSVDGYLTMAAGFNLGMVNNPNKLYHGYLVTTFTGRKSIINLSAYYKFGEKDIYEIRLPGYQYTTMLYPDGAFGLGLGLDTKFSSRHDLHFIGELWNSDISKPTHTGIFLGLRLAGNNFSSDFGLAFFTQPFLIPFASFVWTPFN